MKKIYKFILISIVLLLVLCISVPIGLVFFINSSFASKIIQEQINATIQGSVSWSKHKVSLLRGQVNLHNFELLDPQDAEIAKVKKASVTISLLPLLKKSIALKTLSFDKIYCHYIQYGNGSTNILEAVSLIKTGQKSSENNTSTAFQFRVKNLNIKESILKYHSIGDTLGVTLSGIELNGSGDLHKQKAHVLLSIDNIDFESPFLKTTLDTFYLNAFLENEHLRIDSFICASSHSQTHIDLNGSIKNTFSSPLFDVTCNAAFNSKTGISDFRDSLPISGFVSMTGVLKGAVSKPDFSCLVSYRDGVVYGYPIETISIKVDIQNNVAAIPHVSINTNYGHLSGNCFIRIPEDKTWKSMINLPGKDKPISYTASLLIDSVNLHQLPLPVDSLEGLFHAQITAKGKGLSLENLDGGLDLSARITQFSGQGSSVPQNINLLFSTLIKQGIAHITQCNLKSENLTLTTSGTYNFLNQTVDLIMQSDTLDLNSIGSFFSSEKISGKGIAKTFVKGPTSYPTIHAQLDGWELSYSHYTIGSVSTELYLDSSGSLNPINMRLKNKTSSVELNGKADLFKSKTYTLRKKPLFSIVTQNSKLILEDFTDSLKGTLSLFFDVQSTIDSTAGLIEIIGENLDLGVQKLEKVSLNGIFNHDTLFLKPFIITLNQKETIEILGWVTEKQQFNIDLNSTDISLKSFDKIKELKNIEGLSTVSISGKGTLSDPELSGELLLANVSMDQKKIENIFIQFDVMDSVFSLTGKSDYSFKGTYNLYSKYYALTVSFDSTNLSPYFVMAGQKDMDGFINGTISLKGQDSIIENASSHIEELNIRYKNTNLLSSKNLQIVYKDKQFIAPSFTCSILEKGFFNIQGTFTPGKDYSLSLGGNIPFQFIEIWVPVINESNGSIQIEGTMTGEGKTPQIDVGITLEDINFSFEEIDQKITALNGKIHVSQDRITIPGNGIRGTVEEGFFICSGSADLHNFKPTRFSTSFVLNALPVSIPDMFDITVDADLSLNGTQEESLIEGKITLQDGLYYKDIEGLSYNEMIFGFFKGFLNIVPDNRKKNDTTNTNTLLANTLTNISIAAKNMLIVDNNMAFLEIAPDITVNGNLENPVITGRVGLNSGTITYQKKDFIVTKGIIDFTNPYFTEPFIDIESDVQINEYTLYLTITGTPPTNMHIILNSDSALSDDDMIALLLFGKIRKDLLGKEGFSYQSTEEILKDFIGSKVTGNIKKTTGFDVAIETPQLNSSDDRIKVSLGKDISQRLNTEYTVETSGGDVIQKAIIHFKVSENMFLKGFNDTEGNYGGEIQLYFDKR